MKQEFVDYLKSLGASSVVVERVAIILGIYNELIDNLDVKEIFVSEDLNRENKREMRSVFFFTEDYIMEGTNFVSDTDLDITYVINSVDYMRMQFKNYEPGKSATTESRFRVTGYFISELDFELRASAGNCEKLWKICHEILMPNWAAKPES